MVSVILALRHEKIRLGRLTFQGEVSGTSYPEVQNRYPV